MILKVFGDAVKKGYDVLLPSVASGQTKVMFVLTPFSEIISLVMPRLIFEGEQVANDTAPVSSMHENCSARSSDFPEFCEYLR